MNAENYKYFLLLLIFPIFVFSALAASKIVIEQQNFTPTITHPELKILRIGKGAINVEVADTAAKQEKGLSGRQSMPQDQGMLFVFQKPGYYSFWMKDMKFSLDFVWISGGEVTEITEGVDPADYQSVSASSRGGQLKNLVPQKEVDKVLEVNAGTVKRLGIKIGDAIRL